ncbi:MAG: helix-turn-helix domain-containing protein [Candidatus Thermoplasmatota archaeon]
MGATDLSETQRCGFEQTIELLGQKHVLVILRALFEQQPRRFSNLRDALHINAKTLTDRLEQLEREGLVSRTAYAEIPRRVEYGLTQMGRDLSDIFRPMHAWKEKYAGRSTLAVLAPAPAVGARRRR